MSQLQGDPSRPSSLLVVSTKEALWPCQTDIAEAYGLPGTTEGLQRIQNEVQRAITEGAHGFRVRWGEMMTVVGKMFLDKSIH